MTIDWDDLLTVYRTALEDGAAPDRVVRRYLVQHGHLTEGLEAAVAGAVVELDRLLEAEPELEATPEPAPAPFPRDFEFVRVPDKVLLTPLPDPPPPAPVALAEPAAPLPPAPTAQESPMPSADLGATLLRALPVALSLYQVAHDSGALEEVADAIGGVARRASRLARRGPLDEATRSELCREAREEIRCVLPQLTEEALETLGEIAIDAIDEHTDTGPLEEIDGPAAKRGLAALIERLDLWSSDPGNLDARAERARKRAAREAREAERIERIAARKRARG